MKNMATSMRHENPAWIRARTCHSTNAPIIYEMRMPNARAEAVNDPSTPLTRGDEHSVIFTQVIQFDVSVIFADQLRKSDTQV